MDASAGTNVPECSCGKPGQKNIEKAAGLFGRRKLVFLLILGLIAWGAIYYWLEPASNFITFQLLNLPASSMLGSSVAFFLFDTPKVFLLLTLIVFAVGIVRSFFTPERTRSILAGKNEYLGNIFASLLGVVTPFCSCSAVPLFIGFVEAGVPLGVTFSFLIAAPMINEVAVILLFGLFGWQIALLYIVTGLIIAFTAGWIIGKLKLERYIEKWVFEIKVGQGMIEEEHLDFEARIRYGLNAVKDIVGKVWPYVLVGIAVGAVIHGYVPTGFMASFMGKGVWWSVPAAVILGIPMYSNAAGIIPVVQALMEKGAALGTVLAFMMAVIALSLPEMIILKKVLRWQLIGIFIGVVAAGIIAIGYLFNAVI
jgi:uncharacterized protein